MVDKELAINGSVYYDETAYKAMSSGANPGEIWKRDDGRIFVILAREGKRISTLLLTNKEFDGAIKVNAMVPMYTKPIMVGCGFDSQMVEYIKKVPDEEMLSIRRAVSTALWMDEPTNLPEPKKCQDEERKRLEEKCACLAAENEDLKQGYIDLNRKNNELRSVIAEKEKKCQAIEEQLPEMKEKLCKADIYREMYRELLDRIIAHEVKLNERR